MENRIIIALADKKEQSQLSQLVIEQPVEIIACETYSEAEKCLKQGRDWTVLICDGADKKQLSKSHQQLLETAKTLEAPILMVLYGFEQVEKAWALGAAEVIAYCAPQAVFAKRLAYLLWQKELKWRQAYDVISGVFNKAFFYKECAALLKKWTDKSYALLCLDIERFKLVNDLYGTEEGDNLLHYLGERLARMMRAEEVCGHIVSDVFAICLPYDRLRLEKITTELQNYLKAYPINMELTLAMGVYRIEDAQLSISSMCDRAIMALNTVKGNYQQHLAFYVEQMREDLLLEQQILNNMEMALRKGEFVVYYQPKCEMESGRIVGAEALVRWNSPSRGLINPKEFVELFERNGFILEMDLYVWEQVCHDMNHWRQTGQPVLPVSVNVSKVHLNDPRFTMKLAALVEKYQIPPSLLELEITESACAQNVKQLQKVIEVLREQGFTILMDDFGSGYSSLNILQAIKVDVLKMDMQFLAGGQRGGNILEAVVRMAKWLNLEVIAEGVQNRSQVEFLLEIGCKYAQGYYFYEPMCKNDFEKLLQDESCLMAVVNGQRPSNMVSFDELFHKDDFSERILGELLRNIVICEYFNENLDLLRATEGYYQMIGRKQEEWELHGRHLQQWIVPEDWPKIQKALEQAGEQMEQGAEIVFRQIHPNGDILWTYARIVFLAESGGRRIFCALLGYIGE